MPFYKSNTFLVVGVSLVAIGVVNVIGATVKCWLSRRKKRVAVTITNSDCSVRYFNRWLIENDLLRDENCVEVELDKTKSSNSETRVHHVTDNASRGTGGDTKLVPTLRVGTTYLNIKQTLIRIKKTRLYIPINRTIETITLSACGVKRDFLERLVEEARILCERRTENKIVIYKPDSLCTYWVHTGSRDQRNMKTVILGDGIAESLLIDIKDFLESRQWYAERGVPHRRGYALYGPPGCGKTSVISAIASELNFAVCILNLKLEKLDDSNLSNLLNRVPDKSMILLEDIDCAFTSREPIRDKKGEITGNSGMIEERSRVTFSGLLNAIDGFELSEGRILFLTTNYIEKLDKALLRPGRIDRIEFIDYPSKEQAQKLFARFYPKAEEKQIDDFGKRFSLEDSKRSVAEIQGHFMLYKNDVCAAIERLFEDNHHFRVPCNDGPTSIYM